MYEKEIEQLNELKNSYDNVSTDALDQAILAGMQKAVKERRKKQIRRRSYFTFAAVICIMALFATIRISPMVADYITVIPGMENVVNLIRHDKGMMSAVEHDYYQKIGVSEKVDGLTVTIDGAIADETGLVLFYTLETSDKLKNILIDDAVLKSSDGKELDFSSASYGFPHTSEKGSNSYTGTMEYFFNKPFKDRSFELDLQLTGDNLRKSASLRFSINEDIKAAKVIDVNKTVEVQGQKITFESVTIHPLRATVKVKADPSNTKKLLNFDDIRLVDEYGEAWTKISDGLTATPLSENEKLYFLQSNFFMQPKELYLVFNKIQAIEKDDAWVVVDIEKEEILNQPKGNHFKKATVEGNDLVLEMSLKKKFFYFPFGTVKDGDNKDMDLASGFTRVMDDDSQLQLHGVTIKDLEDQQNPISLEVVFFPSWLEESYKIKIK